MKQNLAHFVFIWFVLASGKMQFYLACKILKIVFEMRRQVWQTMRIMLIIAVTLGTHTTRVICCSIKMIIIYVLLCIGAAWSLSELGFPQ